MQLVAVGLVGGILWYGYRAFKREMKRVSDEIREEEKKAAQKTVLKQDEDGVYRPHKDD